MTSKAKELSAEALEEELIGIRRHLRRHPELSNEEYGTTEYIISLLERAGVRIVEYGLSGVIAEIGGKSLVRSSHCAQILMPCQSRRKAEYPLFHYIPAKCMPAGMISIRLP